METTPEETDQDYENVGDSPEPEGKNARRNESNSPLTPPKSRKSGSSLTTTSKLIPKPIKVTNGIAADLVPNLHASID